MKILLACINWIFKNIIVEFLESMAGAIIGIIIVVTPIALFIGICWLAGECSWWWSLLFIIYFGLFNKVGDAIFKGW